MKTILIAFIALLTISSCNTTKQVTAFLKDKCPDSSIRKQPDGTYKLSISCTDLYKTEGVKKYISEGKITYDVANAELYITGVSKDSIPDVYGLLKSIAKGIKK